MNVWVGFCVGGVAIYVLWILLAEVEGDDGRCSSCKLDDIVERYVDMWSVE